MNIPDIPLGWLPLADAVAKTTLILLAATAASIVLRSASAAMRHLVWTLALSSALVLPIASFALPKWQLPLFTITSESPAAIAPGLPSEDPVKESSVASAFRRKDAAGVGLPPDQPPLKLRRSAGALAKAEGGSHEFETGGAPQPATRASIFEGLSWQQMLAAIWMMGAAVILARILVGLAAVRWLSRRTQEITDAAWLPKARALARGMGVSDRLRFLRSGRASMPVATGIFRPAVMMPADADTWSESRLRIVLLHELAHVKRRDCLTHVLGQAACAFHWFNPLAWLAVKRARTERERACDDLVLACGTRGSDYADQLLEMARVLRGDRFPALLGGASLAMAHRSQLEGRLIAILDPRVPRSGLSRGRALAVVALCGAAVAPLGALQPWTTEQEPAPIVDQQPSSAGLALPPPPANPERRDRPERADVPRPAAEVQSEIAATPTADRTDHADGIESERAHHAADPHPMPVPQPTPMPTPHPVVAEAIAVGEAVGQAMAQAVVGGLEKRGVRDASRRDGAGPQACRRREGR